MTDGWGTSLEETLWDGTALPPIGVSLDDLAFSTVPGDPEGDDYELRLAELDGWWEAPEDRTPTMDHPTGDGAVALRPQLGQRQITLKGTLVAESVRGLLRGKAAVARKRRGVFRVDEGAAGIHTEATVRIDGRPRFSQLTPTAAEFTIALVADDPLRYWVNSYTLRGGAQHIMNRGDQTAWPILTVPGGHAQLTIVHPAGTWDLFATPPGATTTADLRNGDVWRDGVRLFQADQGPAPLVLAGGSQWILSGLWAPGSIGAVVTRHEAYS